MLKLQSEVWGVNQASNIVSIIFSFGLATTDQLTEPLLNFILHYMKAGMFFSHPNRWYRDFDRIASSVNSTKCSWIQRSGLKSYHIAASLMISNQYSEVSSSIRSYDADMMAARMILKQRKIFQLADLQSLRDWDRINVQLIYSPLERQRHLCLSILFLWNLWLSFLRKVNQFLEKNFTQIFGSSWLDRRAKVEDCVIFATLWFLSVFLLGLVVYIQSVDSVRDVKLAHLRLFSFLKSAGNKIRPCFEMSDR